MQQEVAELKLELVRLEQAKSEDGGLIEGLKAQMVEMTLSTEGKAEPAPTESDKVREEEEEEEEEGEEEES